MATKGSSGFGGLTRGSGSTKWLAVRRRGLAVVVVAPAHDSAVVLADGAGMPAGTTYGGEAHPLRRRIGVGMPPTDGSAIGPKSAATPTVDGQVNEPIPGRIRTFVDDVRPSAPAGRAPVLAEATGRTPVLASATSVSSGGPLHPPNEPPWGSGPQQTAWPSRAGRRCDSRHC